MFQIRKVSIDIIDEATNVHATSQNVFSSTLKIVVAIKTHSKQCVSNETWLTSADTAYRPNPMQCASKCPCDVIMGAGLSAMAGMR